MFGGRVYSFDFFMLIVVSLHRYLEVAMFDDAILFAILSLPSGRVCGPQQLLLRLRVSSTRLCICQSCIIIKSIITAVSVLSKVLSIPILSSSSFCWDILFALFPVRPRLFIISVLLVNTPLSIWASKEVKKCPSYLKSQSWVVFHHHYFWNKTLMDQR